MDLPEKRGAESTRSTVGEAIRRAWHGARDNEPRWAPRTVTLAGALADHLVGVVLGAVALAILLWTPDMGFTRDEGFYFKAAKDYLGWFEDLERNIDSDNPDVSFSQENIDKHWSYNPEHPALPKALFALSYRAFSQERDWMKPSTAMRFPTMVYMAVLIWLLYVFVAEAFGRLAAVFACGALFTQPRVFFHAHLACFDVAMTTMWFAVLWAYWKSLQRRGWALVAAVLFGLALSTKLNAFFLPFVLVLHWAWSGWAEFRVSRRAGVPMLHLPRIPAAFFWMAVIGPVVFYLLWPRHWFDSFGRVAWYVERHLGHEHYAVSYFGELLAKPPFPVSFPFVMSLLTVPVVTLLACLLGWIALADATQPLARLRYVGLRLRAMVAGPWGATALAFPMALFGDRATSWSERLTAAAGRVAAWRPQGRPPAREVASDRRGTVVLMLVGMFVPFIIIARPETPVFGGTKHWMGGMPFLAAFAGIGFAWAVRWLLHVVGLWLKALRRPLVREGVALAFVPLVLWPAVRDVVHSHPFGTAYYNELVGSYVGAADAGMQRQFWGYASRAGVAWLNENAPENANVFWHNTLAYCYDMYKEDGLLREDVRHAWSVESAQYVMYHHQRAFHSFLYGMWATFGTTSPVYVVGIDGVPMLSIYENPKLRQGGPAATRGAERVGATPALTLERAGEPPAPESSATDSAATAPTAPGADEPAGATTGADADPGPSATRGIGTRKPTLARPVPAAIDRLRATEPAAEPRDRSARPRAPSTRSDR